MNVESLPLLCNAALFLGGFRVDNRRKEFLK